MSLNIVIPSYKRPERVITKKLVTNPILCVSKSEKDVYAEMNPELEIVTHPDSVKGLPAKRNWMVNHFKELFMLDDDIYQVKPCYFPNDISAANILNPDLVRKIIEKLFTIAKMLDIHLFGFNKNQQPLMYKPDKPYVLNERVTGCSYGVIKSENTFWPDDLILKEDFWISGYVKYKERLVLIDKRISFIQQDTFVNPGGLSEYRNTDRELDAMLRIKKYFGDCVTIKRNTDLIKGAQPVNISMGFPF